MSKEAGHRTPTNETLRQVAAEAVRFFYSGPPFEIVVGERAPFQAIYPLAAHAIEQVHATPDLDQGACELRGRG